MTKLPINYENACIYEIVCKDVNITQRYVGSTTNLIQRRRQHKSNCNNEKNKVYNMYVYQFIRENGFFENWDVVLIEQVIDCKDKENLHKRERYYIEEKKAELNKNLPCNILVNVEKCKEWIEANKEKLAEQMKEYHELNINKITQQKNEWYIKNKKKVSEKNKLYRENNRESCDEYRKKYYQNNKELLKAKAINKKIDII
jgi:hypothetical protein